MEFNGAPRLLIVSDLDQTMVCPWLSLPAWLSSDCRLDFVCSNLRNEFLNLGKTYTNEVFNARRDLCECSSCEEWIGEEISARFVHSSYKRTA